VAQGLNVAVKVLGGAWNAAGRGGDDHNGCWSGGLVCWRVVSVDAWRRCCFERSWWRFSGNRAGLVRVHGYAKHDDVLRLPLAIVLDGKGSQPW